MTGDQKIRGPSLRARALRLLARREHSRHELARKLAAHSQDPAELESVLDGLEAQGWLSERRLAEQVVHSRRSRFGPRRIARELAEKGIGEETVAAALQTLKENEVDNARAIWRKKFARLPRTAAERARQVRFLQGRGFGLDTIMKVVKGEDE